MSTILNALLRETLGTRTARKLRSAGRIPGNLQGGAAQPHLDLSIDEADFLTTRRHHQHLYELQLPGGVETALIESLQWDVFGEHIQHIEFRRVDRHQRTDVVVPLEFQGIPKTGVLTHFLSELTIITTPDAIPDSLIVRVGDLVIDDVVTAGQVLLPEGATLDPEQDPEEIVAQIIEPKADEPEPVEAPAEAAAVVLAPVAPEKTEKKA